MAMKAAISRQCKMKEMKSALMERKPEIAKQKTPFWEKLARSEGHGCKSLIKKNLQKTVEAKWRELLVKSTARR
jgi:hypothetical protein